MIKNLKKITITGIDQVFFALALFYFNFEVLKRLNDDDYATFTNYIGLIAFFHGISKIYIAETIIINRLVTPKNLLSQYRQIIGITIIIFILLYLYSISNAVNEIKISTILVVSVAIHFYSIRSLVYVADSHLKSIGGLVFAVVIVIGLQSFDVTKSNFIDGYLRIYSDGYLITLIVLLIIFIILNKKQELIKNDSNLGKFRKDIMANTCYIYIYSGLIFIVSSYLNPEIVGQTRKFIFLLYPISQLCVVLGLILLPIYSNNRKGEKEILIITDILYLLFMPVGMYILHLILFKDIKMDNFLLNSFLLYIYGFILIKTFISNLYIKCKGSIKDLNKVILKNLPWYCILFVIGTIYFGPSFLITISIAFQFIMLLRYRKIIKKLING